MIEAPFPSVWIRIFLNSMILRTARIIGHNALCPGTELDEIGLLFEKLGSDALKESYGI
jgi:hypothetical protein